MKTWKQYCEAVPDGSAPTPPSTPVAPNYSKAARSITPGGFNGTMPLGQANLTLVGHALQIDSSTHSINLQLTPQQVQQLQGEFQS